MRWRRYGGGGGKAHCGGQVAWLLSNDYFLKIVWPSTGLHHDDIILLNTYIYVHRHDDVLDETSSAAPANRTMMDLIISHSSCALPSPIDKRSMGIASRKRTRQARAASSGLAMTYLACQSRTAQAFVPRWPEPTITFGGSSSSSSISH